MEVKAESTIAEARGIDSRKLRDSLRGELDWIVMTALEKDRNRRYQSASELSEDVQRYLNDESVKACPPTLAYRCSKFVRRNRALIGTWMLIAASLLVGLVGATWQAIGATKERNRAVIAEAAAEQESKRSTEAEREAVAEKAKAEQNLEAALAAMDRMLTHASDPELKKLPLAELIRNRILVDALAFYEQFKTSSGDSPEVRYRAAMVRIEIADDDDRVSNSPLQPQEVLEVFEQGTQELESLTKSFPKALNYRLGLARAFGLHAWRLMWLQGGNETVEQQRERGITLYEREKAEYVRIIELDPENANAYQLRIDECDLKIANAHHLLGNHESAIKIAGAVKELLEHRAPLPDSEQYWLLTTATHTLARANMESNPDSAMKLFRQYLALDRAIDTPLEHPKLRAQANHSYQAAVFFRRQGDVDEAKRLFESAIERIDQLVRDFPSVRSLRDHQANWRLNLSELLLDVGGFNKAIAMWRGAIEADPANADFYRCRGQLYAKFNAHELAIADFTKYLSLAEKPNIWFYKRLAVTHFQLGHYSEALADIGKSLEVNPTDTSAIWWIDPTLVAACPDREFQSGLLKLADQALEVNEGSASALSARGLLLSALGDKERAFADINKEDKTRGHGPRGMLAFDRCEAA